MSHSMLRPLSFGEILDGTFSLYRRHFATFILTALIPALPLAAVLAGISAGGPMEPAESGGINVSLWLIPLFLVVAVGLPLAWAALTRQVSQAVTGGAVSLGDGYAHGKRTFLPLLGMWLLAYAMIAGVGTAFAILLPLSARLAAGAGILVTIVGLAGFAVVLVASIGPLFVGPAAVIIEGHGARAAMRRSWTLIRGGRLRAIGLMFVVGIIGSLPTIGLSVALAVIVALLAPAALDAQSMGLVVLQQVIMVLSNVLTFPFSAGAMTLFYYDRVSRLEASPREVLDEALAPIA